MRFIFFTIILISFNTFSQTAHFKPVSLNFKKIHFKNAIHIEDSIGGKAIFSKNTYMIGECFYPNKNNYPLDNARVFDRNENPYFLCKTEYYVDKRNDSVRAILYEWNYPIENGNYVIQPDGDCKAKAKQLKEFISSQLGKPTTEEIQSKKKPKLYSDTFWWKDKNGINVCLWRYGNAKGDGQVRVIVYWE